MRSLLSFFISPNFIFPFIILSSIAVRNILENKVEKDLNRLIYSIIMLPSIPVIWLWRSIAFIPLSTSSFYGALSFTVFVIIMLLVRIIKYNKRKHEKNGKLSSNI